MKIRIYDDSVRLRLDRSEVDAVGQGDAVVCRTRFPGGAQFRYQLNSDAVEAVTASFDDGCIRVAIPHSVAEHWASDESEVSIRGTADIEGGALTLLIEKDFECLEPRQGEDQSNRFINPKAVTAS